MDATLQSVMTVGEGRGFVFEAGIQRYIATAARCLPRLPPAHAASLDEDRIYPRLLAPFGTRQNVWAECVFIDLGADIAVLGTPDPQTWPAQAEVYDRLVRSVTPLVIGRLAYRPGVLPQGMVVAGFTQTESDGSLLSLTPVVRRPGHDARLQPEHAVDRECG